MQKPDDLKKLGKGWKTEGEREAQLRKLQKQRKNKSRKKQYDNNVVIQGSEGN